MTNNMPTLIDRAKTLSNNAAPSKPSSKGFDVHKVKHVPPQTKPEKKS